jgi:prophage maintenance system killer protein
MSTLVLNHALPNANHRTSIAMAKWYIECADSMFSFPEMATKDHDWIEWVDSYIAESKRLLTIRRNTTAFRLLKEWGIP